MGTCSQLDKVSAMKLWASMIPYQIHGEWILIPSLIQTIRVSAFTDRKESLAFQAILVTYYFYKINMHKK